MLHKVKEDQLNMTNGKNSLLEFEEKAEIVDLMLKEISVAN